MKAKFRLFLVVLVLMIVKTQSYSQTQFHIYPHGHYTICEGSVLTVEAVSGFASYSWNTQATTRVIKVYHAGTYICTALDAHGNPYKDTVVVGYYAKKQLAIYSNPHPAEVCKSAKLIIEATNGFKTYTWSNNLKGNRIEIYPVTSQWLKLIAVDSNGCVYKDSIHIVIKNCNGCELIGSSKKSICKTGDTITLEAKSGYTKYHWSTGDTTKNIKVTKPGKYIITVEGGGITCKDSIEIISGAKKLEIYTNPHPAVVCKNKIVILEANKGFVSYDWSVQGTGNRIEYKAEATKKIYLHAKDSNGCLAGIAIEVKVVDTCNCTGFIGAYPKTVLCGAHDSIHLEAKSGYKSYKWSNHSSNRLIWVYKAGWYVCEVTDSNNHTCRDSIHITFSQVPELKLSPSYDPLYVMNGDTIVFEASTGFKEYNWSTGHHGRTITYIADTSINITITAITQSGCVVKKTISIIVFANQSMSINEKPDLKINIIPNPVRNNLFKVSSADLNIKSIKIFDLTGREIPVIITQGNSSYDVRILSDIKGLYYVSITTDSKLFNKVIIVQ